VPEEVPIIIEEGPIISIGDPIGDPLALTPERRLLHKPSTLNQEVTIDENGRRRLATNTTICEKLYTYVSATHDDLWYDGEDNSTSYFAYVSPHPACPEGSGTHFWKNGTWQCDGPDHDASVEYAYGNCFGRCGAGCGDNGKGTYTQDCVDYDSCVRFGDGLASSGCNDEFYATIDDFVFAPNCF
jgi:hypothetical protein